MCSQHLDKNDIQVISIEAIKKATHRDVGHSDHLRIASSYIGILIHSFNVNIWVSTLFRSNVVHNDKTA